MSYMAIGNKKHVAEKAIISSSDFLICYINWKIDIILLGMLRTKEYGHDKSKIDKYTILHLQ
jgi:hypothetical protein